MATLSPPSGLAQHQPFQLPGNLSLAGSGLLAELFLFLPAFLQQGFLPLFSIGTGHPAEHVRPFPGLLYRSRYQLFPLGSCFPAQAVRFFFCLLDCFQGRLLRPAYSLHGFLCHTLHLPYGKMPVFPKRYGLSGKNNRFIIQDSEVNVKI